MYWEIKWQCVEVDYDGCLGGLLNDVYTMRCDSWEHALGVFIAHLNMDEVARVWWVNLHFARFFKIELDLCQR